MIRKTEKRPFEDGVLTSPADGKLLPLPLVEDEVFSAGILGEGMAIVPDSGEIYAPCDGVVDAVFDSRHAVSMTADFGAELLIHCGIDTVELKGEGFVLSVGQGDHARHGAALSFGCAVGEKQIGLTAGAQPRIFDVFG